MAVQAVLAYVSVQAMQVQASSSRYVQDGQRKGASKCQSESVQGQGVKGHRLQLTSMDAPSAVA